MTDRNFKLLREQKRFINLSDGYGYLKAFADKYGYNYNTLKNARSLKVKKLPLCLKKYQEINNLILQDKKLVNNQLYIDNSQLTIFDFCENPNPY